MAGGKSIEELTLDRALNVAYAACVEEGATYGHTRDTVDKLLRTDWGAEPAPEDQAEGFEELMGGITMDDLLKDDES